MGERPQTINVLRRLLIVAVQARVPRLCSGQQRLWQEQARGAVMVEGNEGLSHPWRFIPHQAAERTYTTKPKVRQACMPSLRLRVRVQVRVRVPRRLGSRSSCQTRPRRLFRSLCKILLGVRAWIHVCSDVLEYMADSCFSCVCFV